MSMDKAKLDTATDEEFRKLGMSPNEVIELYQKAVENDWRTVQTTTQQAFSRFAASRATMSEASELLNLARVILRGENDDHLSRAGLPEF